MRPSQLILSALTVLTVLGISACGSERAAVAPDSPVSSSAAPTTEDLLVGVWSQVGHLQEGVLEAPRGDDYFLLVLHKDGTGTFRIGSGELPDLAALCDQKPNTTWTLSKDGTALEVDRGLVWKIVTLNETSFTVKEASSEFLHDRLGRCE